MKLFPFDPAKAQTVTNPDGFPVYYADGSKAQEAIVFNSGHVAVSWSEKHLYAYNPKEVEEYLRLGPKPGKTGYVNCWKDRDGAQRWCSYGTETEAKSVAEGERGYIYIAIPVTGPEIEP